MKFLYFGDTFGKPGRDAVKKGLVHFKATENPDVIIVNGENMSHGAGIQPEMAEEFFALGVDVITTGNHAWDQKQIIPYFDQESRLIRPANFPESPKWKTPGNGSIVFSKKEKRIAVVQLMGRVFMDPLECPFHAADRVLDSLQSEGVRIIFIDFHGEASSEKQAFAHYLDGRASAVIGSHAHVQTADERILPGGTAVITDVGMCGCYDSVIGIKKEIAIQKFLSKRPTRFEPAEGPGGYGAVLVDIDEIQGNARSIRRYREVIA